MSSLSVRPVLRDKITLIIVTCLQSDLSRSRKIAPGSSGRKFVSERSLAPEICAGSCAGPSGGPSFVIRIVLFAFVAARVQFDPGGPGFVTTLAYHTPVRAQPQLDVIHRDPGGRLFSLEMACYFRRCLHCFGGTFCVILEPRATIRLCICTVLLHKRPSCSIDGLLIDVACCLWSSVLSCSYVALDCLHLFALANGRFNKYIEHWLSYPFLGGNHLYLY